MVRGATAIAWLAAVVAIAACGSSTPGTSPTQPSTSSSISTTITITTSPSQAGSTALPDGVPRNSNGRQATAESARVIKAWLAALDAGKIAKAAGYFAPRAKVQNGTKPFVLRTRAERVAFNATLPCGATAHALEAAAHGYTIVTFLLTERKNGDCGSGTGSFTQAALRVRKGRIADWYRLPDPEQQPAPAETPAGTAQDAI